jgi:hypothetical protein
MLGHTVASSTTASTRVVDASAFVYAPFKALLRAIHLDVL